MPRRYVSDRAEWAAKITYIPGKGAEGIDFGLHVSTEYLMIVGCEIDFE